jgi:cell wall assembly regulator SMI1
MQSWLRTIDQSRSRLAAAAQLRPMRAGLDPSLVAHAMGALDLDVSPDVQELFAWHDGTDTAVDARLGQLWLWPGFSMPSLAEDVANYQAFRADRRWRPEWFPLFADGGGDFYVWDAAEGGAVRHFRLEYSEHPVEFGSLTSLVETLAVAYESRIIDIGADGWLEQDDEAFDAVAARVNPGVAWWRD